MKKKLKGFTLIELIVVIAIIGILAGLLGPTWMNYIANSKVKSQNNNARVIFNAAQNISQEYKFRERKVAAANRDIGTGDFYIYWNGSSAIVCTGTAGTADDAFATEFAQKLNRVFSGSETTVYKIWVENYIVKSVVSGRTDTDMYMGSYPKRQDERATGRSVENFDMSTIL